MMDDPDDDRHPWSGAVATLGVWACAFLGLVAMGHRGPPALSEPTVVVAPCGRLDPGAEAMRPPRHDFRSTEEVRAS
ncbi:hypothetical protein ABEG18_05640 [Alsobacter sp. KACC 23698]|uniref:Uncharacterized protein n=1 Tax=Alsobacter sp. KACC 23698 TaxID=3149229 RepID=A0AAU7JJ30_9HYPH